MACQHCKDFDGTVCFPMYGMAPHTHKGIIPGVPRTYVGSTVILPKEEWPENFEEDPDCPGFGTWWCPHCGEGKPSNLEVSSGAQESAKSADGGPSAAP